MGFFRVDNLAALRAIPSSALNQQATLQEIVAPDPGIPSGIYVWITSNHADDGITFIRPNDYGTQLWQKII